MKKYLILAIAAIAALCSCKNDDGWAPLFVNDTFEGWQSINGDYFPEVGWSIKDGVVTSNPEGVRGGDIMTVKEYGNFMLKGEFKLSPLSNSGIKYFINPGKMPKNNIGCEYQIIDDVDFNEQVCPLKTSQLTGSLYDIKPADKTQAKFDPKDWNEILS